ncbi:MAG TPA: type II secretion system protein [Magnetospirillaceae bacterium]
MVGFGQGTMTRQRGFTLIEMAFVLAIIGLVVGGGILAIGPIVTQAKINQTNTALDQIEAALVVYAIRNNRLPCPADGSLSSTNAHYGLEVTQENAGTYNDTCDMGVYSSQNSNSAAVIPWRTLGLDETYSLDGYNTRISYFPANPMITDVATLVDNSGTLFCLSRNATSTIPPLGAFRSIICDGNKTATNMTPGTTSLTYGTYNIPTYPFDNYIPVYSAANNTTELTSANPGTVAAAVSLSTAPTYTTNFVGLYGLRAAYVLISHGPSRWYGWTQAGSQIKPSSGVVSINKKYNDGVVGDMLVGATDSNPAFVQGNPLGGTNPYNNTAYFDDIVRWRSPSYIIQQCGAAACGNP